MSQPSSLPPAKEPAPKSAARGWLPGLTPVSIMASILGMFLMGMLIQYAVVHIFLDGPSEAAVSVAAVAAVLVLIGLRVLFTRLNIQILSRPEMLCVFYVLLMSAPLMTQGFWHRVLGIMVTIPKSGDFSQLDAYPEALWPHGPNLVNGVFSSENQANLKTQGKVGWEEVEVAPGVREKTLVLQNDSDEEVSSVRLSLASRAAGGQLQPSEPYLVSFLVRGTDFATSTQYFCRVHPQGEADSLQILQARTLGRKTWLQPSGFFRAGQYGFRIPVGEGGRVEVEFGLMGKGRIELRDPQIFNVDAIESAYTGKEMVTQSEFDQLPENSRAGLIVRPDNLWSGAGLVFLLGGYIPWNAWWQPIAAWTALAALVLAGTLAINMLMRRKWVEGERYSLPLSRIPMALIGEVGGEVWYRNRYVWIGALTTLAWCLMRSWNFYNASVPDLNIIIPLAGYFGPEWGTMWTGVQFRVFASLLALAIFFEINVLLSLVVGFFLFRMQYWFGGVSGFNVNQGYPFAQEQQVGGYAVYALIVLIFSWKYLLEIARQLIQGGKHPREIYSPRAAVLLLVAVVVGAVLWANWIGVSLSGLGLFLFFLLLVGFVSSKLRAECGMPHGYFTPYNSAVILLLFGGIPVFGTEIVLLAVVASFFITVSVFFLIPGAQLELLELGRTERVNPRHLVWACALAVVGGMVIGGWVFLSNAYALGGDSLKYQWGFELKPWHFTEFNTELTRATNLLSSGEAAQPASGAANWGYVYGGVLTGVTAIARQLFGGFWFHPIGFLLGPSVMAQSFWGVCLTAAILRILFLKFGGADAVKNKLQPFAVGMFIGAVCAFLIGVAMGGWMLAQGEPFYNLMP